MDLKCSGKRTVVIGAFLTAVIGTGVCLILQKNGDLKTTVHLLKAMDPVRLLPAVGLALFFIFCEALNLRHALKLVGYSTGMKQTIPYAMTGFFFSSITPSASGGQPAQLYRMYRDGIRVSYGTFSLLAEFLCFETASVCWGIAGFCVNKTVSPLFLVGFGLNLLVLAGSFCLMFLDKAGKVLTGMAIRCAEHVCKKKQYKGRILRAAAEYRIAARHLKNHPWIFIRMLLISVFQMSALHSIPYFCFCTLGAEVCWMDVAGMQGLLYISVSSLPLPGAAGVTEGGFFALFSSRYPQKIVRSAMLLSRAVSFYLLLAVTGLGIAGLKVFPKGFLFRRDRGGLCSGDEK